MPRTRRYILPIAAMLLFAALWSKLLITRVSVETTGLFGRGGNIYQRGWPIVFLETEDIHDFSTWPGRNYEGDILHFSGSAIAADAALILGTFLALIIWLRARSHSGWRWRYSLRALLLAVALSAMACGWAVRIRRSYSAEQRLGENLGSNGSACIYASEYCGPEWLRRLVPERKLSWFYRAVRVRINYGYEAWVDQDPIQCIVQALNDIPNATRLSIHGLPKERDAEDFSRLTTIKEVEFNEGNEISSALIAAVSRIPNLHVLDLSRCFEGSDVDWAPLANSKSLETLVLSNSCADDWTIKALTRLPRLSELNLNWTDVTDDSIASLCKIQSLVTLHLGHTKITEEALRRLIELPNLRHLYLPSPVSNETIEMLEKKNINVHGERDGDYRPVIGFVGFWRPNNRSNSSSGFAGSPQLRNPSLPGEESPPLAQKNA